MKKLISLLCTVLLSCTVFVGCGSTDYSEEGLIPLSVGNYWTYEKDVYSGDQIIPELTDSFKVEITSEMDIIHDGISLKVAIWTWYRQINGEPIDQKWFYWNGPDGLYLLGGMSSSDTLVKKILQLKYPARQGDTWEVPRLTYNHYSNMFNVEGTLTYTCISTNDEFETSVGTFTCYVYHTRIKPAEDVADSWDYYDYYAPGIGPVGLVVKSSKYGHTKFKRVVYSYNLN